MSCETAAIQDASRARPSPESLKPGMTRAAMPSQEGVARETLRRGLEWRRDRGRIAKRLRRHPVLAICAVEIAAEHPEAVRERARVRVEERLLLDRIALHAADVAPRHLQPAAL